MRFWQQQISDCFSSWPLSYAPKVTKDCESPFLIPAVSLHSSSSQHNTPITTAAAAVGLDGSSDMAAAPPPQPAACRLVAADELGVLKVIEVPAGPKWDAAAVVAQWGAADKSAAVQSLACSAPSLAPGTPALLALGRKGGRVDILGAHSGAPQGSLTAAAAAGGKPKSAATTAVVALAFVPAAEDRPLQLVVGSSDGLVSVCSCSSSAGDDASGEPGSSSSSSWAVARSFAVGSTMSCLAVDAAGTHIVVGGEGSQPSIWDLATGSKVWQGKGGKPNRVGLVDKPYPTALAFLPCSGAAAAGPAAANGHGAAEEGSEAGISRRFVAGSATAKLHVYDTAAGKRPQQEVAFGESRVTALAVEQGGDRVWAASGTGHMQLWVLKTNKLMDALKGAGGSVRALALYPGAEPWLASVGLDRFLRVHDTSSKASKGRVYLKQQLTSLAWLPPAAVVAVQQQPSQPPSPAGDGLQPAAAAAKSSRTKKKTKNSKGSSDHSAAGEEGGGGGVGDAAVAAAEAPGKKKRRKQ